MEIEFSEIDTAFTFVSFGDQYEHYAYLNRKTGETYYVSETGATDEDIPEDLYENEDYIEIPHKNDLNLGRNLVFDFIGSRLPEDFGKVQTYFSKKGAYSRFKDFLEQNELLDEWHQFENEQIEKELRSWCRINKINVVG
jgi:hypothetical protein